LKKNFLIKPELSKHDCSIDANSAHSYEVSQNRAQRHQASSESKTFNKNT